MRTPGASGSNVCDCRVFMYSGTLPGVVRTWGLDLELELELELRLLRRLGRGVLSLRCLGISVSVDEDDPGSLGPPPLPPAAP